MVANAHAIYVDRHVLYAPALELVALPHSGEPHISRAASSVVVMYCVSCPYTGSNPGGGQILNKKLKKNLASSMDRRFSIHFRGSLSLVIPNNKTIEHWPMKMLFYWKKNLRWGQFNNTVPSYSHDPKTRHQKSVFIQKPDVLKVGMLNGQPFLKSIRFCPVNIWKPDVFVQFSNGQPFKKPDHFMSDLLSTIWKQDMSG